MTDLFIKLLNMSISASWLVLAVLVLRLLLKKAPKWLNPVLWGIVGLRLLCPFSIESALSLIPSAETVSPEIMLDATPTIDSGIPAVNSAVNPIIIETFAPTTELTSANPLQIWIPVCALLWLCGIAVMLLYTGISYLRLRHRVQMAVRLKNNIYQSENVASPFVLGMVRPKIYLPFGMSGQNMAHVIAHEEAHIARRDHWIKPIGFLLLTVYWFNPILWVAYILLCRDIELACDERVIRQLGIEARADYSEALLACSVSRKMISACPLAFGEVGVKERVKNVLNYKKPAFWIVLLAVFASIAMAVCFLTDPKQPTIQDIQQQKGYHITKMETQQELSITIPKSALPDAVFTGYRYVFPQKEIVVYQDGTTTVYLSEVYTTKSTSPTQTTQTPTFLFTFTYHDIGSSDRISTISRPVIEEAVTTGWAVSYGAGAVDITDSASLYPGAAKYGGHGEYKNILVYIDRDVLVAAKDYLSFTVTGLVDIYYEKGSANHEDDIILVRGGVMGQEDVKEPDPILETPTGEVQVAIKNADGIAQPVIDYALQQIQTTIDGYNSAQKVITEAQLTHVAQVGSAALGPNHSVEMYSLSYQLTPNPDTYTSIADSLTAGKVQIHEPFFLLHCNWENGQKSWEPIGTVSVEELVTVYTTPEMLAKYDNAYTAAAATIGGQYRYQKYLALAEAYAVSRIPAMEEDQVRLNKMLPEGNIDPYTLQFLAARVDKLEFAGRVSKADLHSNKDGGTAAFSESYSLYHYKSSYQPNDPAQVLEVGELLLTDDGWLLDDTPRYLVFTDDAVPELVGEFRCELSLIGNSEQFYQDLSQWLQEQGR